MQIGKYERVERLRWHCLDHVAGLTASSTGQGAVLIPLTAFWSARGMDRCDGWRIRSLAHGVLKELLTTVRNEPTIIEVADGPMSDYATMSQTGTSDHE